MNVSTRRSCRGWRSCFLSFLLLALAFTFACAHDPALVPRTVELPIGSTSHGVAWWGPSDPAEAARIARWRIAVGAPVATRTGAGTFARADKLTVVSWNTAVGSADVIALAASVRVPGRPIVMLLQEVYRRGSAVPVQLPPEAQFAARLDGRRNGSAPRDIESIARALDLALYYVPSMRNGGMASDEDRGNAILSSVPLDELAAIELPFERQRRVALSAAVAGSTSSGRPWRIRLVNAHLDNLAGPKRAWVFTEAARARQARGLAPWIAGGAPTILGADLNTWFGTRDAAYRELATYFDQPSCSDDAPTLGPFRLDHMLLRLEPGWRSHVRRSDRRFSSDHFPIVGTLSFH